MAASIENDPIAILQEIEQRCHSAASGLPQQESAREEWLGVGFRLGESRLVTPLGEVVEILHPPQITRVPGTKSWVEGIANVRGNLLPVMDLAAYLRGTPVAERKAARILVLSHDDVFAGLVVDEVLGLYHFVADHKRPAPPGLDESVAPYITGAFDGDDGVWPVFSLHRVAETPEFMQVAI